MRAPALTRSFTRVVCLIACAACVVTPTAQEQPKTAPIETRALWVTRQTLTSPGAVAEMVRAASSGGFNTLLVQVRGRGDAYYRGGLEPRAADLAPRPDFDPLAETIQRAKAAGLAVHVWIAVNLVSSAVDLPRSPQHIVNQHPGWLMVPRSLAAELRRVDVRSRDYVTRLARWTRARPTEVEGLYTSPLHPDAVGHAVAVIREIVSQYAIDGVHLDYVRFPNEEFDYSRAALDEFKASIRPQMTDADRRRLDAREATDSFAYPAFFPDGWVIFRQSRLTAMVTRIRDAIKELKPQVLLSAAVFPDEVQARERKLQDWRGWIERSLLDAICPMAYTEQLPIFEQQISAAHDAARGLQVWAGIGAYRLSSSATLSHIAAARRHNASGVVLFSYDALIAAPNSPTTLVQLGRAAFGAVPP